MTTRSTFPSAACSNYYLTPALPLIFFLLPLASDFAIHTKSASSSAAVPLAGGRQLCHVAYVLLCGGLSEYTTMSASDALLKKKKKKKKKPFCITTFAHAGIQFPPNIVITTICWISRAPFFTGPHLSLLSPLAAWQMLSHRSCPQCCAFCCALCNDLRCSLLFY